MHYETLRSSKFSKSVVHLEGLDNLYSGLGLFLLPHANPYVRVNDIRILSGKFRVVREFYSTAGFRGKRFSYANYLSRRFISFRCSYLHIEPYLCRSEHQGIQHVIAVTDVGKGYALKAAKPFLDCKY